MSRVSKKEEAIKAKYEKLSQEAKPKPIYKKYHNGISYWRGYMYHWARNF